MSRVPLPKSPLPVLAAVVAATLCGGPRAARADEVADLNAAIAREGLAWTAGHTSLMRRPPAARPHGGPLDPARLELPTGAPHRPPPRPDPLPPGVDWRDRDGYDWVTPIRDQGGCGACWSFATLANLEVLMALRAATPDPTFDLAEQHLLDCAGAAVGCDSGGITWGPPGTFLESTGVTSEACYPYVSGTTGAKGTCQAVASMSQQCRDAVVKVDDLTEIVSTIPSYPQWDPPDYTLPAAAADELKTWLQERPVGVSMRVFSDLSAYQTGVYEPTTAATRGGLHAVLLVGYDDPGGYWIVKNSWGADWGEDGFFRIRYGTSSIGMWAFVYQYREADAAPRFCDDLPTSFVLDGWDPTARLDLPLANCGGGVLHWQAARTHDWIALETAAGTAVAAGAEVAAGRSYRVGLTRVVGGGLQGSLTLSGGANGPVTIPVYATGALLTDAAVPADAGAPQDAAPGADAAPGDAGASAGDAAAAAGAGGGCALAGAPGAGAAALAGLLLLGLAVARARSVGVPPRPPARRP